MKNWVGVLTLVLAGCGSGATEVTGTYGITATNGFNGCDLPQWSGGDATATGSLSISQSGDVLAGTATGGLADTYFSPMLGSTAFTGSVDGADVSLSHTGSTSFSQGACDYVVKTTINGTVHDGAVTGIIYYETQTNGSPDCGKIQNCMTGQNFDGVRAD
jgi:hypothetical protein